MRVMISMSFYSGKEVGMETAKGIQVVDQPDR